MSKNLLFEQYEREQKERAECKECKFNWDDKFWTLCEKHSREMAEAEAESEYYEALNAHYALSMN